MARYHHPAIAELALQLKLSPARLRLRQLDAIEHLADIIAADKHYPYEFICHQVTSYWPRDNNPGRPMLGRTLLEDLVLLAEDLSGSHPVPVQVMYLRCWTTEELARRLNVSTKTICRWRRKGLVGRKLRYPDNSVRMAFTEPSIRRFIVAHIEQVRRGAAFSQLTDEEKQRIVELARQELASRRLRLHDLSQVVAVKVGRAVETVRYTLRRHDKSHPEQALFGRDKHPAVPPEFQAVWDAVAAGGSLPEVARRFGRNVGQVRSVLREVRTRRLMAVDLKYIHNQEFEAPNADEVILTPPARKTAGPRRVQPPPELPPYLQELYRCPLLPAETERHLFRLYNYLKFKADRLRRVLDPLAATDADLDAVESLLARADRVKNDILRANLRLVVSIARRHVGQSPSFFETVSDGNLALMRAVEKFDYARGFKFSTYASWAIMRNYARTIPEQNYASARLVTGVDEILSSASSPQEASDRESVIEAARHLLRKGLALLNDRERGIVVRHYGLDEGGAPMTLDQIGKLFGVTKERVRQIERQAIGKLRAGLVPVANQAIES
ncbi:MAG TPA: sigma-70 family RNA polymerase sigma factor [Phycisphaerae bacterium]|nr:sigma-70 family RNA polymerase sigma factor [Phycisphaerae bacterium]